MNLVAAPIAAAPVPTLLCVDDEANVISSLKRLFRPCGYRVITALSGAEGLQVCAGESVDLVISDMRMPEMDGARFLEEVRNTSPETVRILLTGYSDVESTIAAVNKGEIHRYIAKPWDDSELLLTVRQALERRRLEHENRRLEELTRRQNEELRQLNEGLEALVEQRTGELRTSNGALADANERLKAGFLTSIKVFSNLIELREGREAGHSRRVADLARRLARRLGMSMIDAQDVMVAGLLHDIGKIGLPDTLLLKSAAAMNAEELVQLQKHAAKGETALMPLAQLRGVARLVRSHHERFDGLGYPDGLLGQAIPLGARVLAVANDFDALQIGTLSPKRMTAGDAADYIKRTSGKRYDPAVVAALLEEQGATTPPQARELRLTPRGLQPGMILTRDLVSEEGVLLLAADYVLDDTLIKQMVDFEGVDGKPLWLHVREAA
ncbi:MAG: response regulator receiver modulated metal dependent phosphohydrolase [Betaproteobacteria bacterium]|nr:response regulator receiver modulated metal dependent phosphohydrolase [Betaproteobacteria bacterium]